MPRPRRASNIGDRRRESRATRTSAWTAAGPGHATRPLGGRTAASRVRCDLEADARPIHGAGHRAAGPGERASPHGGASRRRARSKRGGPESQPAASPGRAVPPR
jgi:hypothetical protein